MTLPERRWREWLAAQQAACRSLRDDPVVIDMIEVQRRAEILFVAAKAIRDGIIYGRGLMRVDWR